MFSVYGKPTNKDNYINYLSHHDPKTKSGVVIYFLLRAFRICSEELSGDESTHVVEAFRWLGYSTRILNKLKKNAK